MYSCTMPVTDHDGGGGRGDGLEASGPPHEEDMSVLELFFSELYVR